MEVFNRYVIVCLLRGEFELYHHSLVDEIWRSFGVDFVKNQNLPVHFTLKYEFETDNIVNVDEICSKFCATHKRTSVHVGGFSTFPPNVVFVNVKPTEAAHKNYFEFISELRTLRWMRWDRFDAENLHFHATIAEKCEDKFEEICQYVRGKERYFSCWFDNITILKVVWNEWRLLH